MHEKDIGNPRFCIHLDTKTRIDLKYKITFMSILYTTVFLPKEDKPRIYI
jgi:hypothetical protein